MLKTKNKDIVALMENFKLDSDYIELCQLLKLLGPFQSGGEAKHEIANGSVYVDGQVELRKKCKLYLGKIIRWKNLEIEITG